MKSLAPASKSKYYGIATLLVVYLFFLFINLPLESSRDDLNFMEVYNELGGFLPWIKLYVLEWSGRVLPHGLQMLLLLLPAMVFKALNALFMTLLACMMYYFCLLKATLEGWRDRGLLCLLAVCLVLCMPEGMLRDTAFFKSASVLYVWGLAAAFVAMLPFTHWFLGTRTGPACKVLALLCGIYAAFFEQAAPIVVAYGLILSVLCIIREKKARVYPLALLAVAALCMLLCLAAPGNAVRTRAEMLRHLNDFDMLGPGELFMNGIWTALQRLFSQYSVLLLAISLLVCVLVFRQNRGWPARLSALLPAGYYLAASLAQALDGVYGSAPVIGGPVGKYLFDYINVMTYHTHYGLENWVATFLGLASFFTLCFVILLYTGHKTGILYALFMAAAFGSIWVMGFSPTYWVSGIRTTYVALVLMLVCFFRFAILVSKGKGQNAPATIPEAAAP